MQIGFNAPTAGPLASPGKDMQDGFALFWEQANYSAGGRKVEIVTGDTTTLEDYSVLAKLRTEEE